MTIKITLNDQGKRGVDFNDFLESFIDDFQSIGYPFMEEDDQLILIDTLEGRNTGVIVLDGKNYDYDLGSHTVGGTLNTVTLGELGKSYNNDGSFGLDNDGHITGYNEIVTLDGFSITNGTDTRGEFHELVAELMYLGGSGDAGADRFFALVNAERHVVNGSRRGDSYTGTEYNDRIDGDRGNDKLDGAGGRDRIFGDKGNDRLDGGAGRDRIDGGQGKDKITGGADKDKLKGGAGKDFFIYDSIEDSAGRHKDVILDFDNRDKIKLRKIDADTTERGNQKFDFIDDSAFSGEAGELRYQQKGKKVILEGDVDGDGGADFAILLKGVSDLSDSDILL